jgi:hypothetical protein
METNIEQPEFQSPDGQPYFHYRMLKYFLLYTAEDEHQVIKENNHIVNITLENGTYAIRYEDLTARAAEEANQLINKYGQQ